MFLHLGGQYLLHQSEILGIFDLDNTSWAHKTRDFLATAQKQDRVVTVTMQLPRSFVLAQKKGENPTIYISDRSSATLRKRLEGGWDEEMALQGDPAR